jgi:hypothetical protein
MSEQLAELPESPYAAFWQELDHAAITHAEHRNWHEIKPNDEPDYDAWLDHIVLAGGHWLYRRDAFELARYLGDAALMARLFDALPWTGDNLAAEDIESVKQALASSGVIPTSEPIADPNQSEIPWHDPNTISVERVSHF